MDPFKFLGVREEALRSKEGFDKFRAKVKEQHKRYSQTKRKDDAKKVQDAYDAIKKKLGLDEASVKQRQKEKEAANTEAAAPVGPAGPEGPPAGQEPAESDGPTKKRKGESADDIRRREAIAQKLAEKRKQPKVEDAEAVRRQEAIRERLAKKRAAKEGGAPAADAAPAAEKPADAASTEKETPAPTDESSKTATAAPVAEAAPEPDDPVSRRLKRLRQETTDAPADDPVSRRMRRLQESSKRAEAEAESEPKPAVEEPQPAPVEEEKPAKKKWALPTRPTTGIGSRSTRASLKSGRGHFLVCAQCQEQVSREFFRFCKEEEEGFTCPQCRLRAIDPFNPIREGKGGILKYEVLQPPVVHKNMFFDARFGFKRDFRKLKEWKKRGYNIEARMLTIEDYETRHVWPEEVRMYVNRRQVTLDVKPWSDPKKKASDTPKNLTKYCKPKINEFRIMIKDPNVQRFVFALCLTKPQSTKDLVKEMPVVSLEDCKQKVSDKVFDALLNSQDKKFNVSVRDPMTGCRLKMPARGLKCDHLQCFELSSFLSKTRYTNDNATRWACPVCAKDLKSPKGLFIDLYFLSVAKEAGREAAELTYGENATWTVSDTCEPSSESEEEIDEDAGPLGSPLDDDGSEAEDNDGIASPTGDLPQGSPPEDLPEGSPLLMASPDLESDAEAPDRPAGDQDAADAAAEATEDPYAMMEELKAEAEESPPEGFTDPQDEKHYIVVELPKPMGIVFEANIPHGGVFAQEFGEDGAAMKHGAIKIRDQLAGVGGVPVKGRSFDDCIDTIVNDTSKLTKLVLFRGKAEDLYHAKFGASNQWLKDFLKKVESGEVKPAPKVKPEDVVLKVPDVL